MGSFSIAVLIRPMASTSGSSFFCFFLGADFTGTKSLTGLSLCSSTVPSLSVVSVFSTFLAFNDVDDGFTANSGEQESRFYYFKQLVKPCTVTLPFLKSLYTCCSSYGQSYMLTF